MSVGLRLFDLENECWIKLVGPRKKYIIRADISGY